MLKMQKKFTLFNLAFLKKIITFETKNYCSTNYQNKVLKEIKQILVENDHIFKTLNIQKSGNDGNKQIDVEGYVKDKLTRKELLKSESIYYPHNLPVLVGMDDDILLYFNKISKLQMSLLILRKIAPLSLLMYLIKINPFYLSNPVMLPVMVFGLIFYFIKLLFYLSSLQNVVDEIWLDKSGNEIKIIYRNKSYRKFRGNETEEKILVNVLESPLIQNQKPRGFEVFPEVKDFDESVLMLPGLFMRKYYISKKNYFLIPKRAIYSNFEILNKVFQSKSIDFSMASLFKLNKNHEEIRKELSELNYYRLDLVRKRIVKHQNNK